MPQSVLDTSSECRSTFAHSPLPHFPADPQNNPSFARSETLLWLLSAFYFIKYELAGWDLKWDNSPAKASSSARLPSSTHFQTKQKNKNGSSCNIKLSLFPQPRFSAVTLNLTSREVSKNPSFQKAARKMTVLSKLWSKPHTSVSTVHRSLFTVWCINLDMGESCPKYRKSKPLDDILSRQTPNVHHNRNA